MFKRTEWIEDEYDLADAFRRMDRDYYSMEAYRIMIAEQEQTGEDEELDVMGLRALYEEQDMHDIADYYGIDVDELDDDETAEAVEEYLGRHTRFWETDKYSYLYIDF